MGFRLVPKSVTLNDPDSIMAVIQHNSIELGSLGAN